MLQYLVYEQSHAALAPARAASASMQFFLKNPLNPISHTPFGRVAAAGCELFEHTTHRPQKPEFNIKSTVVDGERVAVRERVIWQQSFCRLLHFEREVLHPNRDQKLLIVAPMSGHYATLLRGTVEAMLPNHDVYITDWADARMVPLNAGRFDLADYTDYLMSIFRILGTPFHVMAICQPSVPVLSAVSLMEEMGERHLPASMILIGGPIDTRVSPTVINTFAEERGTDWFLRNVITTVPFIYPGYQRNVYPGFIQLSGFMGMNFDRHIAAHQEFFSHLLRGDDDCTGKHRDFYNEYRAVMDLTAEFFLQTIDTVFVNHRLPKGEMTHRGRQVRLSAIRHVALMTIEGEGDDICGIGQTAAAHDLCYNIPESMREHYTQPETGHYGIFNGSRFRREIVPRISQFILRTQSALLNPRGIRERRVIPLRQAAAVI